MNKTKLLIIGIISIIALTLISYTTYAYNLNNPSKTNNIPQTKQTYIFHNTTSFHNITTPFKHFQTKQAFAFHNKEINLIIKLKGNVTSISDTSFVVNVVNVKGNKSITILAEGPWYYKTSNSYGYAQWQNISSLISINDNVLVYGTIVDKTHPTVFAYLIKNISKNVTLIRPVLLQNNYTQINGTVKYIDEEYMIISHNNNSIVVFIKGNWKNSLTNATGKAEQFINVNDNVTVIGYPIKGEYKGNKITTLIFALKINDITKNSSLVRTK